MSEQRCPHPAAAGVHATAASAAAAAVLLYSPVGEYSKGGYPYPRLCDKCPKGTTTPGRGSYSIDQCGK